jgi:hypothetical protein
LLALFPYSSKQALLALISLFLKASFACFILFSQSKLCLLYSLFLKASFACFILFSLKQALLALFPYSNFRP